MRHLSFLLCTVVLDAAAQPSAPSAITRTSIDSSEDTTVPITRVITVDDGGAIYRSYVVKWKGQEVVVVDNLLRMERKAGDMLPIRVLRYVAVGAGDGRRVITFAIAPPQTALPVSSAATNPAPLRITPPSVTAEDERKRQQALDAEVARGRAARDAAAAAIQPGTSPK